MRLQGYNTVLELIKEAEPGDCRQILQDLRESKSLEHGVKTVQERWISKLGVED
jgi:hypothetical protein